jgi:hypothetical protein
VARRSKVNEKKRAITKKMTVKMIKKKAKVSIKAAKKRYK